MARATSESWVLVVRVAEGYRRILEIQGVPLGELPVIKEKLEISNGHIDKGHSGQYLQLAIGMPLNNNKQDFEDGELKTTGLWNNLTKESIKIATFEHLLPGMFSELTWEETEVYKKIRNFLLVPCKKDSKDWKEWSFEKPIWVSTEIQKNLYQYLEEDYLSISKHVVREISQGKLLHTFSGPNKFFQIRTGDNKPYTPAYFGDTQYSNKKMAYFFTTRFVRDIVNLHRGTKNPHRKSVDLHKLT